MLKFNKIQNDVGTQKLKLSKRIEKKPKSILT